MLQAWARGRGRNFLRAGGAALALLAGFAPALAHAQASSRFSSIVEDAATGRVLEAVNPDAQRHPASLAKLMTLYMLFEALRDHRATLDELVPVSAHAASMPPSKLGIVPGTRLTVQQAIDALVTKSANDVAAALGEFMGGTEARFAAMMTLRAHALGMTHTVFRNASGLPDPAQVTTARDLALLARHLLHDFPEDYHYFSTPSFVWHGVTIPNHDTMLRSYPGADGLKTGYIESAGHNLATSAVRDGVRLVGIVLGANTNWERDADMRAVLNNGFETVGVSAPVAVARHEKPGRHWLVQEAEAAERPSVHLVAAHRTGRHHRAARHERLAEHHPEHHGARLRMVLAEKHVRYTAHHHAARHAEAHIAHVRLLSVHTVVRAGAHAASKHHGCTHGSHHAGCGTHHAGRQMASR